VGHMLKRTGQRIIFRCSSAASRSNPAGVTSVTQQRTSLPDMHLIHPLLLVAAIAVACTLGACSKAPDIPVAGRAQADGASGPAAPPLASPASAATRPAGTHDDGIAWQKQASESDIDAAFARARAENKPL